MLKILIAIVYLFSSWGKAPHLNTNDQTVLSISAGKKMKPKNPSGMSMDDRVQQRLREMRSNSNPDVVDTTNLAKVQAAHEKEHRQMLKFVNSLGFDSSSINKQSTNGYTLLHYATLNGWYDVALALINKGADPAILDASKKSSLDWAYIIKDKLLIKLMKETLAASKTNNTETVTASPR